MVKVHIIIQSVCFSALLGSEARQEGRNFVNPKDKFIHIFRSCDGLGSGLVNRLNLWCLI